MARVFQIRLVLDAAEKADVISRCDDAFSIPMEQRTNGKQLREKLCQRAIVIAAYADEPIGYGAMYANDKTTGDAYLSMLGVRPSYQGKGVGAQLLEACADVARNEGMKRLRLEVEKQNHGAIRLYTKCGFLPTGEETERSIFMCHSLMEARP